MAVWLDLVKRLESTLYKDERLHTEAMYKGDLPSWLTAPLETTRKNAGDRTPVLVINAKGRKTPDTLCVLRLSDVERLTGGKK